MNAYERTVCANIAQARANKGLTQQGLATELGIKRGVVGAWEEGRHAPRVRHLIALCTLFGFTLEQFVTTRLP